MSSPKPSEQLTDGVSPPPSRSNGRLKRLMLLLMWAPAVWIVFFWVVYLVAEVACLDQPIGTSIGDSALITFVVVSTAVALAGVGSVLPWARRPAAESDGDEGLRPTVLLLVGCFVLAVVAVGVPALVLDPC